MIIHVVYYFGLQQSENSDANYCHPASFLSRGSVLEFIDQRLVCKVTFNETTLWAV